MTNVTFKLTVLATDGRRLRDKRFLRKKSSMSSKEFRASSLVFATKLGEFHEGDSDEVLRSELKRYRGQVNLVFTSPPFELRRKKRYGNHTGEEYVEWLKSFAPLLSELLAENGSIVLELGNSWEPGRAEMSTLPLRALMAFLDSGKLCLCQQFVWFNPARLPAPAQWVNVERIRVKDAYTHIWWMAKTDKPKADNREVRVPYSEAMRRLLKKKRYNSGDRPSEHQIGQRSFLRDNGGAIPPNVFFEPSNVLAEANTSSSSSYLNYCRENKIDPHPARMPLNVASFFVKFLTEPGDLVLDPFGGSGTTGEAAQRLSRRWICIERDSSYIGGAIGRFDGVTFERSLKAS